MLILTSSRPVHPEQFTEQLHTAGYRDVEVALTERGRDEVHLTGQRADGKALGDNDRAAVQRLIDVHTPETGSDPDVALAARIKAVYDDPQTSTSAKRLAQALLGMDGDAAVAGRPMK